MPEFWEGLNGYAALELYLFIEIICLRSVATINPIILDGLKQYCNDNPDIPREMQSLVDRLLQLETHDSISRIGIGKLYDQILDKFVDNKELVEWCKDYVNS